MTQQEIQQEKEKKFLERQKERLFGLVDYVDLKKLKVWNKDEEGTETEQEGVEGEQEAGFDVRQKNMVDNVKTYRKRLNKWKNLGAFS